MLEESFDAPNTCYYLDPESLSINKHLYVRHRAGAYTISFPGWLQYRNKKARGMQEEYKILTYRGIYLPYNLLTLANFLGWESISHTLT